MFPSCRFKKTACIAAFSAAAFFLSGCSNNSIADGGSGTGAGNPAPSVVGRVFLPDGNSAEAVSVVLRPADFLKDTAESYIDTAVMRDTYTDASGVFSIFGLYPGDYIIEASSDGESGFVFSLTLEQDDDGTGRIADTLSGTLAETAVIAGALIRPEGSVSSAYVQVFGMERLAYADDSGRYQFTLPAGSYTYRLVSGTPAALDTLIEDSLSVVSGEEINLGTVSLTPPDLSPCLDYECDTSVVSQLMRLYPTASFRPGESGGRITLFAVEYWDLPAFPSIIGKLSALVELEIDHSMIETVPAEIGNLTNLTSLELDSNQLTSLPDEITLLIGLIDLNVEENLLTEIPENIGALTNLTSLDLSENLLTGLPASIINITKLTYLSLTDNSIVSLPADITTWADTYDPDWLPNQK